MPSFVPFGPTIGRRGGRSRRRQALGPNTDGPERAVDLGRTPHGPPNALWDGHGAIPHHASPTTARHPVGAQAQAFPLDTLQRWREGPEAAQRGWTLHDRMALWRLRPPSRAVGLSVGLACLLLLPLGAVWWAQHTAFSPLAALLAALPIALIAAFVAGVEAHNKHVDWRAERLGPIVEALEREVDARAVARASWAALGPVLRAQNDWSHPPRGSTDDGTDGDGVWHVEACWRARSHGLEMIAADLVQWRWQRQAPHKRLNLWAFLSRRPLHDVQGVALPTASTTLLVADLLPHLPPGVAEDLWAQGWQGLGGWDWETAPFPTATAHQKLSLHKAILDAERGGPPAANTPPTG